MKIKLVSGFIILVGVFTVLFIWLKLIDLWYTEENDKIIIVTAIGLIGAIVGGTISGGLTLIGVKLTIAEAKKKERLEEIPKRIEKANALSRELEELSMKVSNGFKDNTAWWNITSDLQGEIPNRELFTLSLFSGKNTYNSVQSFVNKVMKRYMNISSEVWYMQLTPDKEVYNEFTESLTECMDVLTKEVEELTKEFLK